MQPIPAFPNELSTAFIDDMYSDFLRDAQSVPPDWREFFHAWTNGRPAPAGRPASTRREPAEPPEVSLNADAVHVDDAVLQERVDRLIRSFRVRGHIVARIDPLGLARPAYRELNPEYYGITDDMLDREVSCRAIPSLGRATARSIIEHLRATYCRCIGVQFMHIDSPEIRHWLQDRMERTQNRIDLPRRIQLRILTLLTRAVVFEEFLRKKYVGAKSFSLEGSESLIPLLEMAIEQSASHGVEEIVLAMAHRGRLNVLANIIGKSPREIFREFEDPDARRNRGSGDVKYHLGYSSDWETAEGKSVHLSLCFNPSHLEFINPVALGRVRAKQDRRSDGDGRRVMPILIHGDASFAGQGVVQETLNLSKLAPYDVGGTLHIVVNNQLGFTTPPAEGRSTVYATAVAKMLDIPVFHVNGENPEAVAQTVHLAADFRAKFQRDVVIDMYGYRRQGHNEGDEPSFTQPLMYKAIRARPSVRDGYLENLLELDGVSREEADGIARMCREELDQDLQFVRTEEYQPPQRSKTGIWEGYFGGEDENVPEVETGTDAARLQAMIQRITEVPESFTVHPAIERIMKRRRRMVKKEQPIDWATAEALAFTSLAAEGIVVRMTGQDTARGTFSQRHSILYDHETGETYEPFNHVAENQAPVQIANSPLSEPGVLGFEYGYSLDAPDMLVLWEAQFGDFANAAQVIIDQFISSAEDKWDRLSGLVLLLPHGFEGQGPEHASARLERFLVLAAEDNIQIANPTTPAQYFHLLRRQVLRPIRKPLVVLTPKSMLRHKRVTSTLDELAEGAFHRVLADEQADPAEIERILLCSGKIYYELLHEREQLERNDVAILRVEQLYPLADRFLFEALAPYPDHVPALWVQEEPENMGAWRYWNSRFSANLADRLPFGVVCRPASASPATGSKASHNLEQRSLIERAFGDSGLRGG